MPDIGEIDITPLDVVKDVSLPESDISSIPTVITTPEDYHKLVEIVRHHNHLYHVVDKPVITDEAYDIIFHKLKDVEEQHPDWIVQDSPTQTVGAIGGVRKYRHPIRMYSLSNVFNEEQLKKFLKRFSALRSAYSSAEVDQFYCDCKMDGLAVSLMYRDGKLTLALTRGDGTVGENVTENIKMIANIPMRVKTRHTLLVRGEVVVHKVDFYAANRRQLELGKEPFSNPRNYASGSLKQKDPRITGERNLRFYAWELIVPDRKNISVEEQIQKLIELGFNIPQGKMCYSFDEIMSFIHEVERIRNDLHYQIDGVVIKQNTKKFQQELGWNNHDPLWATAWKFTSEGSITKITGITWSMGRTGKLTPIASLEPVSIGGVTVKNVTMNNADYVQNNQLGIGASIIVIRSGDVIPKISEILQPGKFEPLPVKCPYCGEPTIKFEADIKCINPYCPEILYAILKYIFSKEILDLHGFGDQFARDMVDTRTITSFRDLFAPMETKDSKKVPQESLNTLTSRLREINLMKLLMILGISKMGRAIAGKIAIEVGNLQGFKHVLEDTTELQQMPVNPSIKISMQDWYTVEYNRQLLDYLCGLELPYCS